MCQEENIETHKEKTIWKLVFTLKFPSLIKAVHS